MTIMIAVNTAARIAGNLALAAAPAVAVLASATMIAKFAEPIAARGGERLADWMFGKKADKQTQAASTATEATDKTPERANFRVVGGEAPPEAA